MLPNHPNLVLLFKLSVFYSYVCSLLLFWLNLAQISLYVCVFVWCHHLFWTSDLCAFFFYLFIFEPKLFLGVEVLEPYALSLFMSIFALP